MRRQQRAPARGRSGAPSASTLDYAVPAMANRLTQIATRTGDDGSTGLGDGSRVPKDHLRVRRWATSTSSIRSSACCCAEPLPDDVRDAAA